MQFHFVISVLNFSLAISVLNSWSWSGCLYPLIYSELLPNFFLFLVSAVQFDYCFFRVHLDVFLVQISSCLVHVFLVWFIGFCLAVCFDVLFQHSFRNNVGCTIRMDIQVVFGLCVWTWKGFSGRVVDRQWEGISWEDSSEGWAHRRLEEF